MRETLHYLIVVTILPVLIILPFFSFFIKKIAGKISEKLISNIKVGIFITCLIYFFAFLQFKSRVDDILNYLVIKGYQSERKFFDYSDTKNIEYYDFKSTDENADVKFDIVSWLTWVLFAGSYLITYKTLNKISEVKPKKYN